MDTFKKFLLFNLAVFWAAACSSSSDTKPDTAVIADAGTDVQAPEADQGQVTDADAAEPEFSLEPSAPASLDPGSGTIPPGDPIFPSSPSGDLLSAYLKAAVGVGDDAMSKYNATLAALQAGDVNEMLDMVIEAYDKLAPEAYFARYLLISTVGQLPTPKAVNWLADLAKVPLPKTTAAPKFWQQDAAGEELTLRLAAVKALGRMVSATGGDPKVVMEAEQRCVELINNSPYLTVKVEAVEAYLAPAFPRDRLVNPVTLPNNPAFNQRVGVLYQMVDSQHHPLLKIEADADHCGPPPIDGPAGTHQDNGDPPLIPDPNN